MKKLCLTVLMILTFGTVCLAADKVEAPDDCKRCGMDRTVFAHSRMMVSYVDGSSAGTCSLNCVVTDMKAAGSKTVKSFQVADYNTKKLIDARSAAWVIGGSKRGVMTPVAKWAFADRKDADAFIRLNGGKPATFDEALKAAEEEHSGKGQGRKSHEHKGHGDHKMSGLISEAWQLFFQQRIS